MLLHFVYLYNKENEYIYLILLILFMFFQSIDLREFANHMLMTDLIESKNKKKYLTVWNWAKVENSGTRIIFLKFQNI